MPPNDPRDGDAPDRAYDRRTLLTGAGSLAAGGLLASSGLVSAKDVDGREPGPKQDEVLVGISPSVSDVSDAVQSAIPGNAEIEHVNETINYAVVSFPSDTPEQARDQFIDAITSVDQVEYAEPNATIEALSAPNDPYYGSQHAPQQVNCEGAWETTLGSEDVVISIVDQGIQYDHPALTDNMDDSVSDHGDVFTGHGSDPYPVAGDEQHGTHVGGIAAGGTDDGTGHAGISNCSMLSARALDRSGRGALSDIADAVQWSVDAGADIINLSIGASSGYHTLEAACRYAVDRDVLLVGATGNDGSYGVAYPAAYDDVLAVSALNSNDSLASFSNSGPNVDLAAPGRRVVSAVPWNDYARMSGTSMAAPVVSGVAGLVLSAYPGLSVDELRDHLTETAVDVGLSSNAQGSGRVDAAAAVNTVPDGYEPEEGDEEEADEDEEPAGRLLAFITEPDARNAAYEFTAEGPVEFTEAPYESPSGGNIEGGTYSGEDFVEEDDESWHAGGVTGGGHGDAFRVDGPVTAIEIDQPDVMWVELDGDRLSPEEVIEETGGESDEDEDDEDETADDRLVAFVTEPEAQNAEYEFTADDRVELAEAPYESPSGGDIEGGSNDTIEEVDGTWYVEGLTGGGYGDAFTVEGAVTSVEIDQPVVMWIELDGEEVSPQELIEETGGEPDEDEGEDDDESEDDEPSCGDETVTASAEGDLDGNWWGESDRYTYSLRTANPCELTLSLERPADADFTLYATLDGRSPRRWDYDEATTGSAEGGDGGAIDVSLDGDEELRLNVLAVASDGPYTLTVEERGR